MPSALKRLAWLEARIPLRRRLMPTCPLVFMGTSPEYDALRQRLAEEYGPLEENEGPLLRIFLDNEWPPRDDLPSSPADGAS